MKSICAVAGVEAGGTREGRFGLALIRASGNAAGVFTTNIVKAAPVILMRERISRGRLSGVVVNSGCANAFTGAAGLEDAHLMVETAAEAMGIEAEECGVCSTGVIGTRLDLPLIASQCREVGPRLARSPEAESAAARAIMTTDTVEKHALVEAGGIRVAGIAKGSGMIAPSMATMLGFIYTDAEIPQAALRDSLRRAVRRTFNRLVVDGDRSTNDTVLITATGEAGRVNMSRFDSAIEEVCRSLAIQIARDGEGATRLIEVTVTGAPDEEAAAQVARSIVASPLVKTAVYGGDPNWGRVVAAAGYAGVEFDPDCISLWCGDGTRREPLVTAGSVVPDRDRAKALMAGDRVVFELDLASGEGRATAWGCDLTEEYVEINGRYTT
ncbi:MAG: bifunctional glutamate N-acetyltransferase/amino-acid acetyltransferase ArgJ [Methanoculleaceae archaeon]